MKKIVLLNGVLLDPTRRSQQPTNLLFAGGKLVGMGYVPDEDEENLVKIDLAGAWIVPNIVDGYAHLGEPGFEERETFASAGQAAIHGGVTSLVATPDTRPYCDTPEMVRFVQERSFDEHLPKIWPLGSLTKSLLGTDLSEIGLMKSAGAVGFTDCKSLDTPAMMLNALRYSSHFGAPILVQPDDAYLSLGGAMHEGVTSSLLGLKGLSPLAEETHLARDLAILEQTEGLLHVVNVSTKRSVDLIRKSKEKGLSVTASCAPHYLMYTDKDLDGYDTALKVKPPFRTHEDIEALQAGLRDGTIDMLISVHCPRTVDEKRADFSSAEFGLSSLDLFVPLVVDRLHHEMGLDPLVIFEKITTAPQKLYGLSGSGVSLGSYPNLTVIDPTQSTEISEDFFKSKSKNSPFIGKSIRGKVRLVMIHGQIVLE